MTDPTPCDIHGRLMLSLAEGGEPVCDFCVVVAAEREAWYGIVRSMMKSLPWGALKGALMEDSRVKAAIRDSDD